MKPHEWAPEPSAVDPSWCGVCGLSPSNWIHNTQTDDEVFFTDLNDAGPPPVQILVVVDIADMMRTDQTVGGVLMVLDKIVTLIQVAKDTP